MITQLFHVNSRSNIIIIKLRPCLDLLGFVTIMLWFFIFPPFENEK